MGCGVASGVASKMCTGAWQKFGRRIDGLDDEIDPGSDHVPGNRSVTSTPALPS